MTKCMRTRMRISFDDVGPRLAFHASQQGRNCVGRPGSLRESVTMLPVEFVAVQGLRILAGPLEGLHKTPVIDVKLVLDPGAGR